MSDTHAPLSTIAKTNLKKTTTKKTDEKRQATSLAAIKTSVETRQTNNCCLFSYSNHIKVNINTVADIYSAELPDPEWPYPHFICTQWPTFIKRFWGDREKVKGHHRTLFVWEELSCGFWCWCVGRSQICTGEVDLAPRDWNSCLLQWCRSSPSLLSSLHWKARAERERERFSERSTTTTEYMSVMFKEIDHAKFRILLFNPLMSFQTHMLWTCQICVMFSS